MMGITPVDVYTGIVTAIVLSIFTIALKPLREFLFYSTHRYLFWHDKSSDTRCTWDIQWEAERLTIDTGDVSNNYLSDVTLEWNKGIPHRKPRWDVREVFVKPEDWPFQVKLESIVRKTVGSDKTYNLHFVVRRRRRFGLFF